jgi:aldehyde dehydrogenase family 7 protein A1
MLRRSRFPMAALSASIKTAYPFLEKLGFSDVNEGVFDGHSWKASGDVVDCLSPIDGKPIGPKVRLGTPEDVKRCVDNMMKAKRDWMLMPAPKRGEIVRQIGDELRANLEPLGQLLAVEVGKIVAEGKGEVQEFVDVCDLATGLSRQIPGQVLPSERPGHFMMEQWHPIGAIGIIVAFNFPIAVFGWNASISMIAGNTQIWKPSETTNLCSIATQKIVTRVLEKNGINPAISTFVAGGASVGSAIVESHDVNLVSFTGSCQVGKKINERLASRFGRALLELGGNNALFVHSDADVEMALPSIIFGAAGTAGQRCTTLRRLYIHESLYDTLVPRIVAIYKRLKIGNPLEQGVLVGPLHTLGAVDNFKKAVERAEKEGGKVLVGGKAFGNDASMPGPNYVQPTLIECSTDAEFVKEEVFVPICYVMKYKTIDEAIALNNSVEQGLSSSLFTLNMRNSHQWLSAVGSDCGIVNVNVPTNGAEIGGAFGGEKTTGGGRESGSDSWKQYMRRVTSTVNYSTKVPLAQGIDFSV